MPSNSRKADRIRVKPILIFLAHQFIGTWGTIWFATLSVSLLGNSVAELFSWFGYQYSMRWLHWLLTETPYFPVQIATGIYLGWKLYRRFSQSSMLWVWILPCLLLLCVVIAVPTSSPETASVLAQTNGRLSHYFGWGCQPRDHCLDQLMVTLPFYCSVAYSVGAGLALRKLGSNRVKE
jgi:hypothetical protein